MKNAALLLKLESFLHMRHEQEKIAPRIFQDTYQIVVRQSMVLIHVKVLHEHHKVCKATHTHHKKGKN